MAINGTVVMRIAGALPHEHQWCALIVQVNGRCTNPTSIPRYGTFATKAEANDYAAELRRQYQKAE